MSPEAATSDILYLISQGDLIFLEEKVRKEKLYLWQQWFGFHVNMQAEGCLLVHMLICNFSTSASLERVFSYIQGCPPVNILSPPTMNLSFKFQCCESRSIVN